MGRKRIGELLLEQGAIDERQLQSALQYQREHGGRLGSALIAKGLLSERQLVKVLGQTLNLPVVDIPEEVDADALALVKAQFAQDHAIFPLHLEDARSTGRRTLALAVADPLDLPTLEEVEFITGCRVQPVLATLSQIRLAIRRFYFHQKKEPELPPKPEANRFGSGSPPASGMAAERSKSRASEPPSESDLEKDDEEVVALTDEVTARTEVAELIREHEKRHVQGLDENLKFLTGDSDGERLQELERKFWALMRILATRGLISKEEFLAEFDK